MSEDHLNPVIRQFLNADDNVERAQILLMCSDNVVLKYPDAFRAACRRTSFALGEEFVSARVACMLMRRDADGALPPQHVIELEGLRQALAAVSRGEHRPVPESAGFTRQPAEGDSA